MKDQMPVFHDCPDCGSNDWLEGPCGGLSINVKCRKCGGKFNDMGPFGIEKIEPRYRGARMRLTDEEINEICKTHSIPYATKIDRAIAQAEHEATLKKWGSGWKGKAGLFQMYRWGVMKKPICAILVVLVTILFTNICATGNTWLLLLTTPIVTAINFWCLRTILK